MSWTGIIFGALLGLSATRTVWGAVAGGLIGHLLDSNMRDRRASTSAAGTRPGQSSLPISDEFFRTTFEIMGHVAKSDGRVSEAEINAAQRLMQELKLSPREIEIAIECFRAGKSTRYDIEAGTRRLRDTCGQRHDLLRAFMELQLRAALAGNGMSPPARIILTRVADMLGMSGVEFAHMEASLRARNAQGGAGGAGGSAARSPTLAQCYAELQVDAGTTDNEVTKAYRRQMSRHHPDKLVANGLPESMAKVAKEKTQRIQEAYEGIRAVRGMR